MWVFEHGVLALFEATAFEGPWRKVGNVLLYWPVYGHSGSYRCNAAANAFMNTRCAYKHENRILYLYEA